MSATWRGSTVFRTKKIVLLIFFFSFFFLLGSNNVNSSIEEEGVCFPVGRRSGNSAINWFTRLAIIWWDFFDLILCAPAGQRERETHVWCVTCSSFRVLWNYIITPGFAALDDYTPLISCGTAWLSGSRAFTKKKKSKFWTHSERFWSLNC